MTSSSTSSTAPLSQAEVEELREDVFAPFDPHEFDLNVGLYYREMCQRLIATLDKKAQEAGNG